MECICILPMILMIFLNILEIGTKLFLNDPNAIFLDFIYLQYSEPTICPNVKI